MRLANRLAALAVSALVLAACSQPKATDQNVRGIGYVRIGDAIKAHPLYPQLAQIQDSIDAISLRSLNPSAGVPRSPAQIAQQTKALNRELAQAQAHANDILQRKQQDYQAREQAAIHAALAAAGAGTNGSQPVQQMQSVSSQQAQAVTAQANTDFAAYQRSVIAQDNASVQQLQQQFNARADRELNQRATQLQERESQLGLELSQQDAAKRLGLRMKLNNLALADADRNADRAALAALDRQEAAVLGAQRARDQQQIAAFRNRLRAQTASQIAAAAVKVHAQTRAKLDARHNEVTQAVASQLQGLQPQAIPSSLPAATREKLAQIDAQYKSQFRADAQKTIAGYQQAKAELDAQYASLQSADGGAGAAANKELAGLQRQRDELYNKMVEQVKRDAGSVAAKRGLQIVFMNVEAASGGIDLTSDVEKDIESLHQ